MVEAAIDHAPLPVGSLGRNSAGWWGVLTLIATEAALFSYLLFSYYYMAVQYGPSWSPEPHPKLQMSGPDTVILILSSVAVWWGERGLKRDRRGQHLLGYGIAIVLGIIFVVVQLFEWKSKQFTIQSGSYGSLYYTVTGFHLLHVVVGLTMLTAVLAWSAAGYFTPRRCTPVLVTSAYWHFVDAVWIAVFSSFYLAPYLW